MKAMFLLIIWLFLADATTSADELVKPNIETPSPLNYIIEASSHSLVKLPFEDTTGREFDLLFKGKVINGLKLQGELKTIGGQSVRRIFEPDLEFEGLETKVLVADFRGTPSSLIDRLHQAGVPIVNDNSVFVTGGHGFTTRNDITRVTISHFEGTVRDLLLSALPDTYGKFLWIANPGLNKSETVIQFMDTWDKSSQYLAPEDMTKAFSVGKVSVLTINRDEVEAHLHAFHKTKSVQELEMALRSTMEHAREQSDASANRSKITADYLSILYAGELALSSSEKTQRPFLNVAPPSVTGFPPGVAPSVIDDATLRKEYEDNIAKNNVLIEHSNQRAELRQFVVRAHGMALSYLSSTYKNDSKGFADLIEHWRKAGVDPDFIQSLEKQVRE